MKKFSTYTVAYQIIGNIKKPPVHLNGKTIPDFSKCDIFGNKLDEISII